MPFMIKYLELWYPKAFKSLLMNGINKRLDVEGAYKDKYEDLLVHTALSSEKTLAEILAIPE